MALISQNEVAQEERAKSLYNSWSSQEGWVPWRNGGNSDMQCKARDEIRKLSDADFLGKNIPDAEKSVDEIFHEVFGPAYFTGTNQAIRRFFEMTKLVLTPTSLSKLKEPEMFTTEVRYGKTVRKLHPLWVGWGMYSSAGRTKDEIIRLGINAIIKQVFPDNNGNLPDDVKLITEVEAGVTIIYFEQTKYL